MKNVAVILIGPPASGKSTWGEKFAIDNQYTYLSSDRNRARLGRNEDDQSVSAQAFALLKEEMESRLNNGENVVVDACFCSKKARKDFVNIAKKKLAHLRAITFEFPREILLERNSKRADEGGRNVPVDVIDRMIGNYEKPQSPEFDEITTIK